MSRQTTRDIHALKQGNVRALFMARFRASITSTRVVGLAALAADVANSFAEAREELPAAFISARRPWNSRGTLDLIESSNQYRRSGLLNTQAYVICPARQWAQQSGLMLLQNTLKQSNGKLFIQMLPHPTARSFVKRYPFR